MAYYAVFMRGFSYERVTVFVFSLLEVMTSKVEPITKVYSINYR